MADFFPSQSLYAMCFDNPIRFVDPFGLAPKETKEDEEEAPPVDAGGVVVIGRRPVHYWESSFDYFDIQDWFGRFDNADGTTSPGKPGGGGGGGGGSSSGSVYGGQVMQKYLDYLDKTNSVAGVAADIAKEFTPEEIAWLKKMGVITKRLGYFTTAGNFAFAFFDDRPWRGAKGFEVAVNTGAGLAGSAGAGVLFFATLYSEFWVWFSKKSVTEGDPWLESEMLYRMSGYGNLSF